MALKKSDLYSSLWSSADELRGSMDASQYKGKTLWVVTPEGTNADARRSTLDRWYRRELKAAVPALLAKWQGIIALRSTRWLSAG